MTESNGFVENRPVPSEESGAEENATETLAGVKETTTDTAADIEETVSAAFDEAEDIVSDAAEVIEETMTDTAAETIKTVANAEAKVEEVTEAGLSREKPAEPSVPFTDKLKTFGASLKDKFDLHLPELTLGKKILYGTLILIFIFQFFCWYGLNADVYTQRMSSLFSDGTWDKADLSDHFGPYCSAEYELNEGQRNKYDVKVGLGELSAFLVLAKIMMILSLIVFAVYVLTLFANQDRLCPCCAGFNVNSITLSAYLGLVAAALILGFLGVINGRSLKISGDMVTYVSVYPAFGWFATTILTVLAIMQIKKPELTDKFLTGLHK